MTAIPRVTALSRVAALAPHSLVSRARFVRDSWMSRRQDLETLMIGTERYEIAFADQFQNRLSTEELLLFRSLAADSSVVVDIGANVGLFTLLAIRGGCPVIAVEPNRANASLLLRAIAEAGSSEDCMVLMCAISDVRRVVQLFGGGQSGSLDEEWGDERGMFEHSLVPTMRFIDLAMLASAYPGRPLVKVDVEGHEETVLGNPKSWLPAFETPPMLIFERGRPWEPVHPDRDPLIVGLGETDYRVYAIKEDVLTVAEGTDVRLANKPRPSDGSEFNFVAVPSQFETPCLPVAGGAVISLDDCSRRVA